MATYTQQPENLNPLASTGYQFFIKKLPTTNFFCQAINIPGCRLFVSEQPTPFTNVPIPGHKLQYHDLNVTFQVDEELKNYYEIYEWIIQLGFPENYQQRRDLEKRERDFEGKMSDGHAIILSNTKNPNYKISFGGLFPISISDIVFDTRQTSEGFFAATATFKFYMLSFEKI